MKVRILRDYLDFEEGKDYTVETESAAKYMIQMGIAKELVKKDGKDTEIDSGRDSELPQGWEKPEAEAEVEPKKAKTKTKAKTKAKPAAKKNDANEDDDLMGFG